ncbi:SLAP domain-containing protein [Lactobacillus crispatus]|uniref:SLAP domain-containing protein n=1 Tax=Lactobacillus crispatus TaxID=47770 RepID=UPI00168ACD43|nr:SLAP domain-containing protein [Lactobacillus crispatus]
MKYFRNDKLDLVNKEKQRFGFRKLSSGKIASVLLGVTIFGSFALNGQVVKAGTPTDGSQTSAAVDEAKSPQNNKEQSGQDSFTQNDGSHSSSTIASDNLGGEGTTEAETGKTQNENRGDTTSDTNGVGADNVRRTRSAVLATTTSADTSSGGVLDVDQLLKKYPEIDAEHAQKLLDYYNNLIPAAGALGEPASTYGQGWVKAQVQGGGNPDTLTNNVITTYIGSLINAIIKKGQSKFDQPIKDLQALADQYPDNQDIQNALNKVTEAQKNVNADNFANPSALADAMEQLDDYGSSEKIKELEKAAKNPPAVVNKDDLQSAVNEAATVKAANSQASEDKQKAYQDAIAAGQNVLNDGKASQADVTNALSKIEQAKKDMTVSAIQKAVDEASDTKGKPNYYNASDEAKKAYNDALDKANRVLADPKATQDQLDEANSALTSAKAGLTGVATDNSGLEKAVNEANTTKLDDKYYNASQDKKQAYDEALAQATKLLNDKNASQKAVAEAVANLEKAKAELNGEPNFIGGDYTPSEPSTPSTETPAEKTTEKILMHASYLYDNKGIKIDKPTVKSYVTVVVAENPVTINGIKYYKVAGKDEYIKAGNIDGTLRVITHNSYIYNNKGKATRNKGIKRLVKKTRIVRTYGAPINIKGHMMYRIAKNRYIKARNFEGTLRRLSHNSFVYDENGKATRNKGIRRLLKKSRVVRTFDAPVKINGHMMYRVDNGYVKVKNFK